MENCQVQYLSLCSAVMHSTVVLYSCDIVNVHLQTNKHASIQCVTLYGGSQPYADHEPLRNTTWFSEI